MSTESTNYEMNSDILSLDLLEEKKEVRNIIITTNDGVNFEVPSKYLEYSTMLKFALEDSECKEIELSLISSKQFEYTLEYIKQLDNSNGKYSNLPKPIIDTTLKTYLSEWELNYIDNLYKEGMLAKLADASNYLDVKSLLDLICAKIAALLKGKINNSEIDNIINSL